MVSLKVAFQAYYSAQKDVKQILYHKCFNSDYYNTVWRVIPTNH